MNVTDEDFARLQRIISGLVKARVFNLTSVLAALGRWWRELKGEL
jgi:hypothetical protein